MIAQVMINNPGSTPLAILVSNLLLIGLMSWLVYFLVRSFLWASKQKMVLKLMRQSIALGKKEAQWLKDRYSDLEKDSIATLHHPEFIGIIEEDQKLYDKICSLDINYAKVVMPPKDLHQKLIGLATCKNSKP